MNISHDDFVNRALSRQQTWLSICYLATKSGFDYQKLLAKNAEGTDKLLAFDRDENLATAEIQRASKDTRLSFKLCSNCGASTQGSACAGCKQVAYCSRTCQKADWPSHRDLCRAFVKLAGDCGGSDLPRKLCLYLSHALCPSRPRLCKAALQTLIAELPSRHGDLVIFFFPLLMMYLWLYTGYGIPAYLRPRLVAALEQNVLASGHINNLSWFRKDVPWGAVLYMVNADSAFSTCRHDQSAVGLANDSKHMVTSAVSMAAAQLSSFSTAIDLQQMVTAGCDKLARLPMLLENSFCAKEAVAKMARPGRHLECSFRLRGIGLVAGPLRLLVPAEVESLVRRWGSNAAPTSKGIACVFISRTLSLGALMNECHVVVDANGQVPLAAGSLLDGQTFMTSPMSTELLSHRAMWSANLVRQPCGGGSPHESQVHLHFDAAEEVDRLLPGASLQTDLSVLKKWSVNLDLELEA